MTGSNFIQNFIQDTPSLKEYVATAKGGEPLDFKTTNGTNRVKYTTATEYYRGGLFAVRKNGTPIVASARDIGNIAAGYISAKNHLPWKVARFGFDALETKQKNNYSIPELILHYSMAKTINIEGKGSQAAQYFGFKMYK